MVYCPSTPVAKASNIALLSGRAGLSMEAQTWKQKEQQICKSQPMPKASHGQVQAR